MVLLLESTKNNNPIENKYLIKKINAQKQIKFVLRHYSKLLITF